MPTTRLPGASFLCVSGTTISAYLGCAAATSETQLADVMLLVGVYHTAAVIKCCRLLCLLLVLFTALQLLLHAPAL
jgi:hypothetical protein